MEAVVNINPHRSGRELNIQRFAPAFRIGKNSFQREFRTPKFLALDFFQLLLSLIVFSSRQPQPVVVCLRCPIEAIFPLQSTTHQLSRLTG